MREEENRLTDLVDDICLPAPGRGIDGEGAEHNFAVNLELGVPGGEDFRDIDSDIDVGGGSGIKGDEYFEVEVLGLLVEVGQPAAGQGPV